MPMCILKYFITRVTPPLCWGIMLRSQLPIGRQTEPYNFSHVDETGVVL